MQIFNVRFGLATNSSSTHSLIFLDNKPTDDYDSYFGWDFFTVSSEEGKLKYVASHLAHKLYHLGSENIAKAVFYDFMGTHDIEYTQDYYIDHQSQYILPNEFGTNFPDKEFFTEFKDYLLKSNLVILGGNDNEDANHRLDNGSSFTLPFPQDQNSDKFVCRKDPEYNYWALFNKESGTKVRFSFDDLDQVPEKAFAPELIDIKITDFCNIGCSFCYQGSTEQGKHADNSFIRELAESLGELKVFEVALGGGETTSHPEFLQILKEFKDNGVIPNFTTKSLAWLKDPTINSKIIDLCGGFAYSVTSAKELDELLTTMKFYDFPLKKLSIHLVMGTLNEWQFYDILKKAADENIRVTLLGFKTNHRGATYDKKDYKWWLNSINKLKKERGYYGAIGIDTKLAQEYEQEIIKAGVPKWMFHTQEGKFSCYIDAVSKQIGPSSYCDEEKMIFIDDSRRVFGAEHLKSLFKTF